jgi:prevent-host-death family protein
MTVDQAVGQPVGERFLEAVRHAAGMYATDDADWRARLAHGLRVSGLVLEDGGNEDELIGAVLHDAEADDDREGARLQDIRAHYGVRVAEIVSVCATSYNDPQLSWRAGRVDHLEQLEGASIGAVRVALADNLDHVRGLVGALHDDRASGGWSSRRDVPDAGAYYAGLARVFARRLPGGRAAEFGRLADQLGRAQGTPAAPDDPAHAHVAGQPQIGRVDAGMPMTTEEAAGMPMAHVGIRELAANVSAVVAEVTTSGQPKIVTKHGAPVAALVSIEDLNDLIALRASREAGDARDTVTPS